VFFRLARRGSDIPPQIICIRNSSSGKRDTISFTVRFWAFVLSASANDGVKTVMGRAKVFSILCHWITQQPRYFDRKAPSGRLAAIHKLRTRSSAGACPRMIVRRHFILSNSDSLRKHPVTGNEFTNASRRQNERSIRRNHGTAISYHESDHLPLAPRETPTHCTSSPVSWMGRT
jgi:hypothetical protein